MNIYILLRIILHSLLSATNVLALTAAAWSISASKTEGQPRAPPGAAMVIVGTIAFSALFIMIWAECCIPRTLMSRVRTELALVPMLIVFQLITAAVATSNTVEFVCRDPTSCITLLVLSWVPPFCLIVYYLIILAITLDHARTNPSIWDASPLDHPWFSRPPHSPPKIPLPMRPHSISLPTSLRTQPSIPNHQRQRSSWMPPPTAIPEGALPSLPVAQRDSLHSTRTRTISIPNWARELRPLRRGIEQPFPVRTPRQPTDRWEDPRRIDAPVSPSVYTEFP